MKTSIINIRIDEHIKNELELIGHIKNITTSDVVRDAINKYLKDNADIDNKTVRVDESQLDVIQTLGFTELIFWIYHKRIDPEIIEIEELYAQFIDLISEFEQYPIFKPMILKEFAKVSIELEEILYGDMPRSDFFEFPQDGPNGFDYEVLADFMYTIRYDDDNNKVIHIK